MRVNREVIFLPRDGRRRVRSSHTIMGWLGSSCALGRGRWAGTGNCLKRMCGPKTRVRRPGYLFFLACCVGAYLVIVGAEPEENPFDYNSTRVMFHKGLHVSPRDGRYMVMRVDDEDSDDDPLYQPVPGDQLVKANDHLISSLSLSKIMEHTEGTFVLPVISKSSSVGHQLARFIKIELFEPHTLTFRPTEPSRQMKIRKFLIEKRSVEKLERQSEEMRKQTRSQTTLQRVERQETHRMLQDNVRTQAEESEKAAATSYAASKKKEQADKQLEAQRIAAISKETHKLMELEKQKEELAKAKSQLEVKTIQIEHERAREKKQEENSKLVDKSKEETDKYKAEVRTKQKEREENDKSEKEQKAKTVQKMQENEAIRAAEKAAAQEQEREKKEEAEKFLAQKEKEERERKWDIVEMSFKVRGPLGLFFVPDTIPMKLDRDHHTLKAGDEMIDCNGMDLLQYESVEDIMAVLIEATWPRVFKFRRAREQPGGAAAASSSGGGDHGGGDAAEFVSSAKMTFTQPSILVGHEVSFQTAKYGMQQILDCKPRALVNAEPADACKPLKTFGVQDKYTEKLVVTTRGVCQFAQKTEFIEKAGGEFTIVINNANDVIAMPAPKGKQKAFEKSSVMITKDDGNFLRQVMKIMDDTYTHVGGALPPPLMAQMASEREGCASITGDGMALARPWQESERGDGQLHVWNGQRIESFDIMLAQFGHGWSHNPVRIVIGNPLSGCDERGFSVNVQNSIVIVERGECSFVDKARLIQKVGGIGMVCVNSMKRPRLLMMPAGPDGATDVRIGGLMIESGAMDTLKNMLAETPNGKGTMIARVQVKASQIKKKR